MLNFTLAVEEVADLEPEFLEQHPEVVIVPVMVSDDGEARYDFTPDTFYPRLVEQRKNGKIVRSTYAREKPYDLFKSLITSGKDFLYLGMTTTLSRTFDHNSRLIHDLLEEAEEEGVEHGRVEILESRCISPGFGLLVRRIVERCTTMDEVIEFVTSECDKIVHLFTLNDFAQVLAGGRVKKYEAIAATALSLRPYMRFDYAPDKDDPNGHILKQLITTGKVRGDVKLYSRMIQEIVARIATKETRLADPTAGYIVVSHGAVPERAERFTEMLKTALPDPHFTIIQSRVGPAVGSHVGETVLAIFFTAKEPSEAHNRTWLNYN